MGLFTRNNKSGNNFYQEELDEVKGHTHDINEFNNESLQEDSVVDSGEPDSSNTEESPYDNERHSDGVLEFMSENDIRLLKENNVFVSEDSLVTLLDFKNETDKREYITTCDNFVEPQVYGFPDDAKHKIIDISNTFKKQISSSGKTSGYIIINGIDDISYEMSDFGVLHTEGAEQLRDSIIDKIRNLSNISVIVCTGNTHPEDFLDQPANEFLKDLYSRI